VRAVVRRRALAQLLHRPAGLGPLDVARHLLAIQAQDLVSARRAIRARSQATTAADVDRALGEERTVLITWLNRGTLHLVDRKDYPWLLGLTAPRTAPANARRLQQEGVTPAAAERGVAAVVAALEEHGPLTRDELREHIAAARVRTEGQATIHILMLAGLRGLTVRGPVKAGTRALQAYALTRDWLGAEPPPAALAGDARDRALAELARRYLRGHGPASEYDLATWSGLALRDVRRGLSLVAAELVQRPDGMVDLAARRTTGRLAPRLLASFDPLLVGWKTRDWVIEADHQRGYLGRNGIVPAVAIAAGRALGTWSARRQGGELHVEVTPFAGTTLDDRIGRALDRDAEDLRRFEAT
jgi:hypothetical protein